MRARDRFTRGYMKRLVIFMLVYCMLFNMPLSVVLATISGHDVQYGDVTVHYNPSNTIVDITSQNAVINWGSLDTLPGEVLRFLQLNSSSAVLNRVMSGATTQFDGSLFANGRVFIVNTAGVIFGAGATINVNQLVASGLNITNDDFLNGRYEFSGGIGSVINHGNINAESVALIGKKVYNTGTIAASGYVILAAGDKVFLAQPGSNIIVEMDIPQTPSVEPVENITEVINEGTISVSGGRVILASAGDAFSKAVGNIDQITAPNQRISRVGQFGTVTADSADGNGGSVSITAGDTIVLGDGSVTTANAGSNGDGGEVVVYTPGTALFREGATIEAKGGTESGNGGFIEVSGKEHVEIAGMIDLSAENGQNGTFLIDPYNIFITDNGVEDGTEHNDVWKPNTDDSELDIDTLEIYLTVAGLTIQTEANGNSDNQEGNVTFDAGRDLTDGGVNGAFNGDLTIDADGGIYFKSGSGIDFTAGDRSLTLNADKYIGIEADIELGGGTLTMTAAIDGPLAETPIRIGNATISTVSGDINLNNDVLLNGSVANVIDAGTATLTVNGSITKTGTGDLTLGGATGINLDGTVDVDSGSLVIEDSTVVAAGKTLSAGDDIIVEDNKTLTGLGDLFLIADSDASGEGDTLGGEIITKAGATIEVEGTHSLSLKQKGGNMNLDGIGFGNESTTDLLVHSEKGSLKYSSADEWKSIQAVAKNNIELSGNGTITVNTRIESIDGGVKIDVGTGSLVADSSVIIKGTSDESEGIGVELPFSVDGEFQRAAIIITADDDLSLSDKFTLIAEGNYDKENDDRLFMDLSPTQTVIGTTTSNNPIDAAVYLASKNGNVALINATIETEKGSTVVIDAQLDVAFGDNFIDSLDPDEDGGYVERLEVVSTYTETLDDGKNKNSLPWINSDFGQTSVPGKWFTFNEKGGDAAYVLRGRPTREVLTSTGDVPLVVSTPAEVDAEQMEDLSIENWLEEEGLELKSFLARAYSPSHSTDQKPVKVARELKKNYDVLDKDKADGSLMAALSGILESNVADIDFGITEEERATIRNMLAVSTDSDAGKLITAYRDIFTIFAGTDGRQPEIVVRRVDGRRYELGELPIYISSRFIPEAATSVVVEYIRGELEFEAQSREQVRIVTVDNTFAVNN